MKGGVQSVWNPAYILPWPKATDPRDIKKFRVISLRKILSNVMEK